jgi:hypothetical protein
VRQRYGAENCGWYHTIFYCGYQTWDSLLRRLLTMPSNVHN